MTNKTKWTPGPWTLHRLSNLKRVGTARFAVQAGAWTFYAGTEDNARLVAAAPDLYAALSALADLARSTVRPSGQPALCKALLDIEGIARAALSKAEGR